MSGLEGISDLAMKIKKFNKWFNRNAISYRRVAFLRDWVEGKLQHDDDLPALNDDEKIIMSLMLELFGD